MRVDHNILKIDLPIDGMVNRIANIKDKSKGAVNGAISGARDGVSNTTTGGNSAMSDSKSDSTEIPQKELDRIQDRLDSGETVVHYARSGRKLGSKITNPSSIYATAKRVIIRDPTRLGMGEDIEEYQYTKISNVKLNKGRFRSDIVLSIPGVTSDISQHTGRFSSPPTESVALALLRGGQKVAGRIDGLDRERAEQIYSYIRTRIEKAEVEKKKEEHQDLADSIAKSMGATQTAVPSADDPLKLLKIRYVKGEITKEEFEDMKSVLE